MRVGRGLGREGEKGGEGEKEEKEKGQGQKEEGEGPITLLSRGVPNLRLDPLIISHGHDTGRELDTNRAFLVRGEAIASETREEVGLPHATVPHLQNC
jgi:hypothetical protein